MSITRTILATSLVLLAATAAAAQSGGMTVRVLDDKGEPLPGAQVTISHGLAYVKTTTELTNAKGIVEFPVLRPGDGYVIQVSFPGFSQIKETQLHVRLSQTLPVTVQLFEEITEVEKVSAKAPMIELDQAESSTRFTDDFIADLPVPGRFYQNVLTMAPGVQDADGDGNPNVHGSRSRDFNMIVSGLSNVDPLTGQTLGNINMNSIEEMEVITSGAGVEFRRAQGGYGRIIQKQGSNNHEGVVEFYFRTSVLDGDGADDDSDIPDQEFDSYQPGFQFTGPLIKDKLWYRASFERIDDEVPINVTTGIVLFEQERETRDAAITWQASPRNKIQFLYRGDPQEFENFGVSSARGPESAIRGERDVDTYTVLWTAPYSPKVLVNSTLGWQEIGIFDGPTRAGVPNDCVPNSDEPFLSQAYCSDLTRGVFSGSWWRTNDDQRQRFTLGSDATVYGGQFLGMSHEFKVGLQVLNERFFRNLDAGPRIFFQVEGLGDEEDDGSPPDEEEGPTLEAFGAVTSILNVPRTDDVRATTTVWSLYGEDKFKPTQNLTVAVGVGMDREEINADGRQPFNPGAELQAFTDHVNGGVGINQADPQLDWPLFFTGYENIEGFTGQLVDTLCGVGAEGELDPSCETLVSQEVLVQTSDQLVIQRKGTSINLTNTNVAPVVSVGWLPWANGKTKLQFAAGRYYNNIPLTIPLQELDPVQTTVQYRASLVAPENCPEPDPDDPDPPAVACGETEVVGGVNPLLTILTVDRDLQTPYQDTYSFKVERELWAETAVSVEYINRKYRDQIQDININLASGDLGVCNRQTVSSTEGPVVGRPGTTRGLCSESLTACLSAADCAPGESCGYDYYLIDPVGFCGTTNDCLDNEFSFPNHACQLGVDPYCGLPFPDMNPGEGDGFVDPLAGFIDADSDGYADDNCIGNTIVQQTDPTLDGCDIAGDPFGTNCVFLERPDNVTDLYLQNPFWGDVFLIGNYNKIDYEAWVLELVRRHYRSWEMNASYTWSEATGDGEDILQEIGDDPTLKTNVFGYQSYDQTHVVKFNATTVTPWGVRLGTSTSWQSGLPYSILVEEFSNDVKPPITASFGGEGSRPRQTYPTGQRNDQRNDSYWNVDLKATKELRLAKDMILQLSAEVYNVLDDGTYMIYNPDAQSGQQLNGTNESQQRFGRRWQMGMRLTF